MMKEKAPEEEQSEFNSAIATLKRIDAIKKGLIITTIQSDYDMQFKYLKAYYKELISVMADNDDKAQQDRFKEVRKHYNCLMDYKNKGKSKIPREIVDAFDDWEIELKNIEQKYGMNMPKQTDSRFALSRR